MFAEFGAESEEDDGDEQTTEDAEEFVGDGGGEADGVFLGAGVGDGFAGGEIVETGDDRSVVVGEFAGNAGFAFDGDFVEADAEVAVDGDVFENEAIAADEDVAVQICFNQERAGGAKNVAANAGFFGDFDGATGDKQVVFDGALDDDGVAGESGIFRRAREIDAVAGECGEAFNFIF